MYSTTLDLSQCKVHHQRQRGWTFLPPLPTLEECAVVRFRQLALRPAATDGHQTDPSQGNRWVAGRGANHNKSNSKKWPKDSSKTISWNFALTASHEADLAPHESQLPLPYSKYPKVTITVRNYKYQEAKQMAIVAGILSRTIPTYAQSPGLPSFQVPIPACLTTMSLLNYLNFPMGKYKKALDCSTYLCYNTLQLQTKCYVLLHVFINSYQSPYYIHYKTVLRFYIQLYCLY